jgi:putative PIG3 family NAD(P)H quinone oxidoreductase
MPMKAIRVLDDDDNSLEWSEASAPEPEFGEVLIEVEATAVNRADLLQRMGAYDPPPGTTDILGLEAAGVVTEVGTGVTDWSAGDRVCTLLPGGGYAEYVTSPAPMLLEIPDNLSFVEAAAIPEVFYTAYLNIMIEADQTPGERMLVHAGASGVGTAAIQLCRLFGSPVFATASESKLDFLRELGVAAAIDRRKESFYDRVMDETDGEGVDIILDPVGADYLEDNLEVLRKQGRLVCIGLLSGTHAQLNMGRLLRRRLRIIGSVLRSRSLDEKVEITRRFRDHVWSYFANGELEPIIYREMPIQKANEAHSLLRNNETIGKVVLRVP